MPNVKTGLARNGHEFSTPLGTFLLERRGFRLIEKVSWFFDAV
jgi:hypothetical protein